MCETAATIIRNVFQFAKILSQASGSDVAHWDVVSVCNALDWADYCEELYHKLKVETFDPNEFDSQLAQMTLLIQPALCFCLSLDALQDAKGLVANALFTNPNVPEKLRHKLLTELNKTDAGKNVIHKIQERDKRLQMTEEIYKAASGSQDLKSCHVGFQAQFLIKHLLYIAKSAKKKDRFKFYCFQLFGNLAKTQEGQDIIVCMLLLKTEDIGLVEDVHHENVVVNILNWIESHTGDWVDWPLHKADTHSLAKVSKTCHKFLPIYLRSLSNWADSFLPVVDAQSGLTWRSPAGEDSQSLISHFDCLISCSSSTDGDGRRQIVDLVVGRVGNGGLSVWRYLASQLLHLLKQG